MCLVLGCLGLISKPCALVCGGNIEGMLFCVGKSPSLLLVCLGNCLSLVLWCLGKCSISLSPASECPSLHPSSSAWHSAPAVGGCCADLGRTLYTVQFTVNSVQCTVYSVHCRSVVTDGEKAHDGKFDRIEAVDT